MIEQPSCGPRTDLWVGAPHDLAIEVKYLRSHLSGSQPARPMHDGQLLAAAAWPGKCRMIRMATRGCTSERGQQRAAR